MLRPARARSAGCGQRFIVAGDSSDALPDQPPLDFALPFVAPEAGNGCDRYLFGIGKPFFQRCGQEKAGPEENLSR